MSSGSQLAAGQSDNELNVDSSVSAPLVSQQIVNSNNVNAKVPIATSAHVVMQTSVNANVTQSNETNSLLLSHNSLKSPVQQTHTVQSASQQQHSQPSSAGQINNNIVGLTSGSSSQPVPGSQPATHLMLPEHAFASVAQNSLNCVVVAPHLQSENNEATLATNEVQSLRVSP